MKSRGSQCNETLLVRAAVRPGKKLGKHTKNGTVTQQAILDQTNTRQTQRDKSIPDRHTDTERETNTRQTQRDKSIPDKHRDTERQINTRQTQRDKSIARASSMKRNWPRRRSMPSRMMQLSWDLYASSNIYNRQNIMIHNTKKYVHSVLTYCAAIRLYLCNPNPNPDLCFWDK